jgi:ribosomal protein S18 acetylase RimI-like enzyme
MRDATGFATQWAGMVALVRLQGEHAPGATLLEVGGMVGSVMPVAPRSSIMNCALAADPRQTPTQLQQLAEAFEHGGAHKWGLWVDGDDERAAHAAREQGLVLDSRPAPMVADLNELPFDDAPPRTQLDLETAGRVNDLAYGYQEPKMAPAIAALPPTVLTYGDDHSVALAYDVRDDTAVWFVATLPEAQGQGRAGSLLRRLMLDARERGQRTASLQASPAGKPLYERLGFRTVGTLHLYEQRLAK